MWFPSFDSLQSPARNAVAFLLNRWLEEWTTKRITPDQLKFENDKNIEIIDLGLEPEPYNLAAETYNLPFELISGTIDKITLNIPWTSIFKNPCSIKISGLRLTLQPKQRPEPSTSMFQSVLSSMTSSFAKEYLQDHKDSSNSSPVAGVEVFTQTIESILNRIKVEIVDTVIRFEYAAPESTTGLAVEIRIKNFGLYDEDVSNIASSDTNESTNEYSAFITKNIILDGVTFHVDEFSKARMLVSNSTSNSPEGYSALPLSPTNRIPSLSEKNSASSSSVFEPIIFGQLSGRQEIRCKYKRNETTLGPEKEILVTLGSFTSFLSPRQVHILTELMRGLTWPDSENSSKVHLKTTCVEKPMVKMDFNRVENELLNQMKSTKNLRTMDLRHTQGWSTASIEDSDNEEEFFPMRGPGATSMNNSVISNNSSMEGSFSGSSISLKSSVTNVPRHKHRHSFDTDPSTETTQIHIQITSVAVVLLHDEILATGKEGCGLTKASVEVMTTTAKSFFAKSSEFFSQGLGNRDFEKTSKFLEQTCQQSHLRFLGAPLVIECSEKFNNHNSVISGNLTLGNLEVIECLIDKCVSDSQGSSSNTTIYLLKFSKDNSLSSISNKTNFEMRFNHVKKAQKRNQKTKFSHPHTDFNITLAPCQVEFDITIIDRISALLNPSPIFTTSSANSSTRRQNFNQQSFFDQAVESPSLPDSRIDVKISSTKCIIKLRFPIPDLRPLHDMNRVPWYKRSVRPDYVTLHLSNAKVHSSIESRAIHSVRHEIQCSTLLFTYTKENSNIPVEIGRATSDECRSDNSLHNETEGFNWPRIVITLFPKHFEVPLDDSSEGEPESGDSLENTPKHQPSPFSSKRVIHESDIRRSKNQNETRDENDNREGEELIIPGNRQEIMEFIEEGTRSARIQIEIGLPCVSAQIPSKYLYELIYNRFNTDLLLWEPSAPRPKCTAQSESNIGFDYPSLLQDSIQPKFSMCKSGIQYDSESDSDEGIFYPASERSNLKQKQNFCSKNGQSKIAVTLTVNQGLLSLNTPVRDSMQKVIPGQQGEIIMQIKDATVFSVSKYKGDDNLGFVCSLIKDVSINHCGLASTPSQDPLLKSINTIIPKHCTRSIYRTESGANISSNSAEKDMLSLAIKIQAADDTRRIKTYKVAVGISNTTLRHRVTSSSESLFMQLKDCLDVMDYPISGYNPPGVLTELYCHLWDSAIDYRPLRLPLKSLITIGSLSISSNIAAQTNTSTQRFIAEDVALFLSNKTVKAVNLKQDYVCVMDFGLFELSLRMNEKMCGGAPKFDLRASNNVFNIRTCSDSCRSLSQLITYFADNGDLALNTDTTESITVPSSEDGESLLDESINTLSKRQIERVSSLMVDAMEDLTTETAENEEKKPSKKNNKCQTKVFFFPGEASAAASNEYSKNATTIVDYSKIDNQDDEDDDDEDFCILGEEAGVGIAPRSGVPDVRNLIGDAVRVVDNHFAKPLSKTDVLKAPKSFPPAIYKYTICDMNINWRLYGGKDFDDTAPEINKHISFNENANNYGRSRLISDNNEGVGYSKSYPNKVKLGNMPNSPRIRSRDSNSWQIMGGRNRDHKVLMELQLNKIRFQNEIYPEDTKAASRLVFVVKEFEIRDHLEVSQINKFLYLYSSSEMPKRSHANMFTVKATHVRPDPKLPAQECILKISLLPLRLNIDQDSFLFLINFFTEFREGINKSQDNMTNSNRIQSSPGSKQGTPIHQRPVMSVNDSEDIQNFNNENEEIDRNLMTLLEDELTIKEKKSKTKIINETREPGQPIYFRSVEFLPEGFVKLDYQSKRIDFEHGTLAGLVMSIGDLHNIELRLKRLSNRHGLLGFDKLINFFVQEWTDDLKSQIASILGGIGPLTPIVKFAEGVRDFILMPIEQYQKDGRIVRGVQRGAYNFSSSTLHSLIMLTERFISAVQLGATTAYDLVNPGPSLRIERARKGTKEKRKRFNYPLDFREGINNAVQIFGGGFGDIKHQLLKVANEEHEQKGVSGAVGGVLRQLAPSVVAPIIIASEASNNILGGIVSQMVPDARHEAMQKWKKDDDFREVSY